jgi:hypothetical protein
VFLGEDGRDMGSEGGVIIMIGVKCGMKALGDKLVAMKHILPILIGIEPNVEFILYHNPNHIRNLFHLLHNQYHNPVLQIDNYAHNGFQRIVYPRGDHD